jgi:SAM-dependent methyltransferase
MDTPLAPDSRRLTSFLDPYIHKSVSFRYSGRELRLDLSHALFSSFDIDRGTRLLLKVLARSGFADGARSLLDLGCGVGILGIALGSASPGLEVHFRDRDALAAAFAARNARANGLAPGSWGTGLTLAGLAGRRFDRIVSNVPAKAGPPVIEDFLRRLPAALSEDGRFALVVVNPIAPAVRAAILASGAEILAEEAGPGHTVIVGGRGTELPPVADELAVYERCRSDFELAGIRYPLSGYWGLPDFDTPSFAAALAAGLCARAAGETRVRGALIGNPGPGHAALWACGRFGVERLRLVSRDFLQTAATRRNLAAAGFSPDVSSSDGLDPGESLEGAFDLVVEFPDPVPEFDWIGPLWDRATRSAAPGAALVLVSRPTEAGRFDRRKPSGWTRSFERKRDGFSGLAYRRQG